MVLPKDIPLRGSHRLSPGRLDPEVLVSRYVQAGEKTTGYRESVGLFIPLPKALAKQFPSLAPEDNSPPHVTLLYVGPVQEDQDQLLIDTVRGVFAAGLPTVKAKLDGLDTFDHPDKVRRVAHCRVRFNYPMSELRTRLRSALEAAGIEVQDSFPVYRPHVTLQYMPGLGSVYEGPVPEGTWEFSEVEIWGLPKAHKVSFKSPAKRAARPIPLDKSALRSLVKRLEKQFARETAAAMRTKADKPIRWREVWAQDSHFIKTVMGEEVEVDVILSANKNTRPGPYVEAGGYGLNRRSNRPVVIIQLNGSYTASEYNASVKSGILQQPIYNILIHEMTHAADAAAKAQYKAGPASGSYTTDDLSAYYNDPKEVRAFMQQVVDEVLNFGSKRENIEKVLKMFSGPRQRGVEILLKRSDTWQEVHEHLTPQNRNKILKAVYRSLVDEGLLKSGSTAITYEISGGSAFSVKAREGRSLLGVLYTEIPKRLSDSCAQDILTLSQRYGKSFQPLFIGWVQVNDPKKGIGTRLYQEALKEATRRGMVLLPATCAGKTTEPAARRIWDKLKNQHISEGDAVLFRRAKAEKRAGKQAFVAEDGWDDAGNHRFILWPDSPSEEQFLAGPMRDAFAQAGYATGRVTRDQVSAVGVEVGQRLNVARLVESHLAKTAGYFSVGDEVLFGKYKNKKGIVVNTGRDEKGNPFIEIEPVPKGRKKNKTIGVLKVWHADPEKRAATKSPDDPTEFEELAQKEYPAFEDMLTKVVAKYKAKHKDDEGNVHYEYSEKQVEHRNREKAKRIEGLKSSMPKLHAKVKKDLKSSDPQTRMTALAVALMDETYERVGNDTSADEEGHFGVTGWQAGHLSFGGKGVTISYTGKSGVKQKKTVTTPEVVKVLREVAKGKKDGDKILSYQCEDGDACVSPEKVNKYLSDFGITAKDIRGYHANDEMLGRLRAIRVKGPKLPKSRKEKDEILRKEFERALDETAKIVGHEAATLKTHYLVPNLKDSYLRDGTVVDSFTKKGTKDQSEKEDESADGLVKREPQKKPPRNDLRRRRVNDNQDDPDLKPPNATNDPDLSHNYKGRNARNLGKLQPLDVPDSMGGSSYAMDVRQDRFVHFTPSSRALEILRTKKLLMNPPYKKFGIDAVAAVSLTYGEFVPGVQTTHIDPEGEELVGLVFTTSAVPDVGYVEEVLWKRDVPLSKVQIVPANRAKGMLNSTPVRLRDQDIVVYEGSKKYKQLKAMEGKVASLVARYVLGEEGAWWEGKTFPHKTEDGKTTQVSWKSLTPEEQAKYQKEHEESGEEEKKPKKAPTEKKPKKKKDPGDPALTPKNLAADPSSAKLLWQSAGEGMSPKDLVKLFKNQKQVTITEDAARQIVEMKGAHPDAATLGDAVKEHEKTVIQDLLRKSGIDSDTLKERLSGMDAAAKQSLIEAMSKTEAEYMEKPVTPDEASALVEEHGGEVAASKIPRNPAALGRYMAERAFTQNVVLNPLMTGGRAVSDTEKTDDELSARAAAAFDTFKDLSTEARGEAVSKVNERLEAVDPESNEAKELNAILDGLALAGTVRGENTPGRPPPSSMFTAVAKTLEKQGEAHTLLKAVDQNSTEGRNALVKGLESLGDHDLVSATGGTEMMDVLGQRLLDSSDPEAAQAIRQIMVELATDDVQFVDPMIRDGLEASGKKGEALSQKDRDKIRKGIHDDQAKNEHFGGEDLSPTAVKNLRMSLLQRALMKVQTMLGDTKSMAATQVKSAIEANEPDILNVPTAKPVSRPVEGGSMGKKGGQSGAYTPNQMSEGPCPFVEWGMIKQESPRPIRRNTMSKLLTTKGASQMIDHAHRLAHVIQNNWEALGFPSEKHALDLAYRLDLFSDTVEKKASEDAAKIAAARKQAETVGQGTISDSSGADLRGGTPPEDNAQSVPNGYDPSDIGRIKEPAEQEADEPYMDAFTQDEFHQLSDLQQSGAFSNARAASVKEQLASVAQQLSQVAAAL